MPRVPANSTSQAPTAVAHLCLQHSRSPMQRLPAPGLQGTAPRCASPLMYSGLRVLVTENTTVLLLPAGRVSGQVLLADSATSTGRAAPIPPPSSIKGCRRTHGWRGKARLRQLTNTQVRCQCVLGLAAMLDVGLYAVQLRHAALRFFNQKTNKKAWAQQGF